MQTKIRDNHVAFRNNIEKLLEAADTSSAAIAKKIGISASTLTNLQTTCCNPTFDILIAIADYFEVSLDELTGRSQEETEHNRFLIASKATGLNIASIRSLAALSAAEPERRWPPKRPTPFGISPTDIIGYDYEIPITTFAAGNDQILNLLLEKKDLIKELLDTIAEFIAISDTKTVYMQCVKAEQDFEVQSGQSNNAPEHSYRKLIMPDIDIPRLEREQRISLYEIGEIMRKLSEEITETLLDAHRPNYQIAYDKAYDHEDFFRSMREFEDEVKNETDG